MTMNITHDLHVHTYLSSCCQDKERMTVANVLASASARGLRTVGFSDHLWMNAAVPASPLAPGRVQVPGAVREHLDDDAAPAELGDRRGLFGEVATEGVHVRDHEHIAGRERVEEAVQALAPALEGLSGGMPEPGDRHAEAAQPVALLGDRGHVLPRDHEADEP